GSYYTFPMLLAAKIKGIPVILHEQNRRLGRVNKLLAPAADALAVHFPDTSAKTATYVVDMPLRPNLKKGVIAKSEAVKHYGFDSNKFTFLIFGGSQGAQKINQAFFGATDILKHSLKPFQVLHFTGEESFNFRIRYAEAGIPAYVTTFEPH